MKNLKTPILFIAFNRPDATKEVFAEIRKARPEKLFFAVDGPRPYRIDDIEKCRRVREIIKGVDWPCVVQTLFRDTNLGCKHGATTAITWFFENVEEGIIIEDDCVPDSSFFPFCTEMLEHFRHENRVAMICGYNIGGRTNLPYSYTFSRYGHLWGWASWRRVWNQYDINMEIWDDPRNRIRIKKAMDDRQQWNYREWLYNETYEGRKDTWDYQWESYRLFHGQICVIPANNMIRNVGFGADATHTKQTKSHLIIPETSITFPLKHNPNLTVNDTYDRQLRPLIPAPSKHIRFLKAKIKSITKDLAPPIIYKIVRSKLKGSAPSTPSWNTLEYEPMKNIKMFFDPRGSWQKKMIDGSYDKFMFDRLSALGVTDKILYDIGAHVGFHSLYFARLVGKNGKVFAFEPNQKNFERLNLIVENNPEFKDRITTFNIAISDRYGTEEFNLSNDIEGGRSSGNFIGRADTHMHRSTYKDKGFYTTTVQTIPIDMFAEKLNLKDAPHVIKLDVEGAEYLALSGAQNTLLSKKPILIIEIHSMLNMFNVVTLLSSLSYECTIAHIEGNGVCYIEAQSKK